MGTARTRTRTARASDAQGYTALKSAAMQSATRHRSVRNPQCMSWRYRLSPSRPVHCSSLDTHNNTHTKTKATRATGSSKIKQQVGAQPFQIYGFRNEADHHP